VFDFIDTFDTDSFGTDWDLLGTGGPTSTFPGGTTPPYVDTANSRAVLDNGDGIQTQTFTTDRPTTIESKWQSDSSANIMFNLGFRNDPGSSPLDNDDYQSLMEAAGAVLRLCSPSCTNFGPSIANPLSTNTWYINKLFLTASVVQGEADELDGNQITATGIGDSDYTTGKISLDADFSGSGTPRTLVDWVRVRQHTATEPTGSVSGENQNIVFCDGSNCNQLLSVAYQNTTTATATTIPHDLGFVNLKLNYNYYLLLLDAFEYVAAGPSITLIDPDNGPVTGGTLVTVTGSDFVDGAIVTFDGTDATITSFINSTTLNAVTPAHAAGAVDVTVTNPDTQSDTATGGFTYTALPPQTCSFIKIDNEYHHSLGIKADGTVWAWGANNYGQLGDETTTTAETPVQVHGAGGIGFLQNVVAVAAGDSMSFALKSDGTLWAWGRNNFGQLGDGTNTDSPVPVQVSISGYVTDIQSGFTYGVALKSDGTVWTWGLDAFENLGNGAGNSPSNTPAQVSGLTTVTVISAGGNQSFAIKSNGQVWAWGYNGPGQLGIGNNSNQGTPQQVTSPTNITTISTNGAHTLALKNDGTVWESGDLDPDNLGTVTFTETNTFTQISGVSNVAIISAGLYDSYTVKTDGTFWDWGLNAYGQLGNGTTTDSITPGQITSLTGTTIIGGGFNYADAIITDAVTYQWGSSYIGASLVSSVPVLMGEDCTSPNSGPPEGGTTVTINGFNFVSGATVSFGGTSASSVIFVNSTTLTAVTPIHIAGTVNIVITNPDTQALTYTNLFTFIAPPPTVTLVTPDNGTTSGGTAVTITGTNFADSAAGPNPYDGTVTFGSTTATSVIFVNSTTLTAVTPLHTAGAVSVIVTNSDLQSNAANTAYTYITPPPIVACGPETFTAVSSSGAIKSDNTIWLWGGLLGDGTFDQRYAPGQLSGVTDATYIYRGATTFYITTGGDLWAFGANNGSGQLGDGTTDNTYTPVQVSGMTSGVVMAQSSVFHSIALKSDGSVWTWGNNSSGQLGDGTNNESHVPIPVPSLTSNVVAVSASQSFSSLALKDDGTVWAWGYNSSGQLGNGTTANSNVPVQVVDTSDPSGFLQDAVAITAGADYSVALKSDGTVWTWGNNSSSQLGYGVGNSSTANQIPSFTNVTAISSGQYYHTVALKGDNTVWEWGFSIFGDGGAGGETQSAVPIQVIGLTDVTAIAGGPANGHALKTDGTIWAWGSNSGGLGDGTTINRTTPVEILRCNIITPMSGPTTGGTAVTIHGSNFVSGATVTFDGIDATSVVVVNSSTITAVTPANAVGPADVKVTNPDTQNDTAIGAFTYYLQTINNGTATVESNPATIDADGTTTSTITVTVYDQFYLPIQGLVVEINDNGNPGDIIYNPVSQRVTTNSSGVATLTVASTRRFTATFTATTDPDGSAFTLTDTADVTFICVISGNEQCAQVNIESELSVSAPDNFSFGTVSAPNEAFSKNDATYILDSNDYVTVTDTRGSSGFNLQVQAAFAGFTDGASHYLPLQNFWVATTAASTGGTQIDGVEYTGSDITPETILAPVDTSGNSLLDAASFTNFGSSLGSGSTFTAPGDPVPIDLMLGGVTGAGRVGAFKQNVNYYLGIPIGQPIGTYNVTLTFTVTDAT